MTTLRANQITVDDLNQDLTLTADTGRQINLNPSANISGTLNATTITGTTVNANTTLNVQSQSVYKNATDSTARSANDWIRVATIPPTGAGTLRVSADDGSNNTAVLVINVANNNAFNNSATLQQRLGFKPTDMKYRGTKPITFIRVLGHDTLDTEPLIVDVQSGVTGTLNLNIVAQIYPDTDNDFTVGGFNDDTAGVVDYSTVRTIKVLPVGGITQLLNGLAVGPTTGFVQVRYNTILRNDLEIDVSNPFTTFESEEDCVWNITFNVVLLGIAAANRVESWLIKNGAPTPRYANFVDGNVDNFSKRIGSVALDMAPTNTITVEVFSTASYNVGSNVDPLAQGILTITRTYL